MTYWLICQINQSRGLPNRRPGEVGQIRGNIGRPPQLPGYICLSNKQFGNRKIGVHRTPPGVCPDKIPEIGRCVSDRFLTEPSKVYRIDSWICQIRLIGHHLEGVCR